MHQSWKSLSVVFGAALTGALMMGALMSVPTHMTSGIYADQIVASKEARQNIDTAEGLSSAFRNVAEALKPSVVSISTETVAKVQKTRRGGNGIPPELRGQLPPWLGEDFFRGFEFEAPQQQSPAREGMGSGVIASADGYVLTNNHVVEGADKLTVELSDGRKIEGKVVGTDPATDLAVVKIEATGLQPAVFGDSDNIKVGDWVLAIGSPFGLDQTVTAGIISGKNRVQGIIGNGDGFEDFLQTDAAINPGNSGGPLVNLRGELIGINTAILSRSGSSAGIGFAIPVSLAHPVMDSIIENGAVRRGFVGAAVGDVNPQTIKEFDLKATSGALISSVVDGQPAAKAGLQPGDVVVKIDGKAVTSGAQMKNMVASKAPGSSVQMEVNRGGQTLNLTVKLEERTKDRLAALHGGGAGDVMGAKLQPLTEELADKLGIDTSTGGFVITDITDGSLASNAGFNVGDVLVQINNQPLTKLEQLKAAVNDLQESGRAIRLVVRRGNSLTLAVITAQDLPSSEE